MDSLSLYNLPLNRKKNEVSEEENKTDDEQIESSEASGFCFMFTWFVIIKKSRVVLEPQHEKMKVRMEFVLRLLRSVIEPWGFGTLDMQKEMPVPPKLKQNHLGWIPHRCIQMHVPVPKIAKDCHRLPRKLCRQCQVPQRRHFHNLGNAKSTPF